jgi:hypothetical protein
MIRTLAIIAFLTGSALVLGGLHAWTGCGSGCAVVAGLGVTATRLILAGVVTSVAGIVVLVASLFSSIAATGDHPDRVRGPVRGRNIPA